MYKFLFAILLFASILFSQPYNVKTLSYTLTDISYDTLRQTGTFYTGDYEGITVVIQSPAKDSSVFAVCYQRGYQDGTGTVVWDRPGSLIDTMNTLVSGNFQTAGSWINSIGDSDLVAGIDSVQVPGYVTMIRTYSPYRSPYGRVFIKGLTDNKKANYNVLVTINMTKYIRTDVGTAKQPEY